MTDELLLSIQTENDLAALAVCLGAERIKLPAPTAAERKLIDQATPLPPKVISFARALIREGEDPLGEVFSRVRGAADRRAKGATYTPEFIVHSMIAWAKLNAKPLRIVDAGAGSGRFSMAAARAFHKSVVLAVEPDPLAVLVLRANIAAAGLEHRILISATDYRETKVPPIPDQTLFIGNPPYVRHHLISPEWKGWLSESAKRYGYTASQLAGLHVHFFVRTLELARRGDRIVLITAAEWLDVNYGELVRELFLNELGGKSIHLIEPKAQPFPDAATTAAVVAFEVGATPPSIRVKRVDTVAGLGVLAGGKFVKRERLEAAHRWGPFFRPSKKAPEGYVELGELCSVHRGAVTGANRVWIAGEHSDGLPESVLFASVTKARELLAAGAKLVKANDLRKVIDLPVNLDVFEANERKAVNMFLKKAKAMGAHHGYVAEHRRAWWSVGLRAPAPILSTYMARRAPAFVINEIEARHINIAHGIYPREEMSERALQKLANHLTATVSTHAGRTYAGGLTKFEPGEVERLLVPTLATLEVES